METFFIICFIFYTIYIICFGIGKFFSSLTSITSTTPVEEPKKENTELIRKYCFKEKKSPEYYLFIKEREIMYSELPDDLKKSEISNLWRQYYIYRMVTYR